MRVSMFCLVYPDIDKWTVWITDYLNYVIALANYISN